MKKSLKNLSTLFLVLVMTVSCIAVAYSQESSEKAKQIVEKTFQKYSDLLKKDGKSLNSVAVKLSIKGSGQIPMGGSGNMPLDIDVIVELYAARPHHQPGSARIRRGAWVLIDWGARVAGYCSDLTRVVFIGRIPPRMGEVYEVVRRAQAAGIAAARSGAGCKSVDAAARRVIEEAGYGEQFMHSLGHGLGRQVHEFPGLGRKAKKRLRAGMVVTIEPGIYLPGVGGVRIEDDILITRDGCRRLSGLSRDAGAMML